MCKITNFLYCLNVDVNENNGMTNINGLLNSITPEYIPSNFSFSIFFTILDLEEGEHSLDITFFSPNEEVMSIKNAIINYKKDEKDILPKEFAGINVSIDFQNLVLKSNGEYYTKIFIDNIDLGDFKIYVKGKNV